MVFMMEPYIISYQNLLSRLKSLYRPTTKIIALQSCTLEVDGNFIYDEVPVVFCFNIIGKPQASPSHTLKIASIQAGSKINFPLHDCFAWWYISVKLAEVYGLTKQFYFGLCWYRYQSIFPAYILLFSTCISRNSLVQVNIDFYKILSSW